MEKKQVEICCPTCSSRLLVDVRSEQVLRTRRPEELDTTGKPKVSEGDWDDAMGRVQDRAGRRESKLDEALERERSKADRLDDLFRQASEKLDEDED
jgi:hypothetical protein